MDITRHKKEVNYLTETTTQSKVTKLSQDSEPFYKAEETSSDNFCAIKINSSTSDNSAFSIDILPSFENSDKRTSMAKNAFTRLKKAFSLIAKKSLWCTIYLKTKVKNILSLIVRSLAKAIKKDGIRTFYKNIKDKLCFSLKKLRSEAGTKLIFLVSLVAFCFTICLFSCSVGYKVTVGNIDLGIISSSETYNEVYHDICENVFNLSGKEFTLPDKARLYKTIALKRSFLTKEQFAENLKSTSADMIPAYTIVIDNKMIVSLPSEKMAREALNEYKNSFSTGIKGTEPEFANTVEIVYMFSPKYLLHSKDTAVKYLLNGEFSYYKSDSDQTVSELSSKTGVSEDIILKFNIIDNSLVSKGQLLKLYSGKMFADVKAVHKLQREEAIPFETVKKISGELYLGVTKIEEAGSMGIKHIDEYVTYINGIEVSRDVLCESVLKAPVSQVEIVGTKEVPSPIGTGKLVMPTSGSLSSRFGSRWGRQHQGIDLSASEGTPIYAADNGTVTYSQYNDGGYGYMVKIDHGNGIKTYYAHCSELIATKEQIVAKGDLIAKVGNTGRSTGPHLHFEIRQEDIPVDPMNYIN